jgi:cold-inducible RNA-binding protein
MLLQLVILSPCLFGLAFPQARVPSQKLPEPLQRFWRVGLLLFCCEILMTKLYVGNLPFTATEDAVRNLFTPHGTVEKLSLITDRDTGRPRGFGFVEMSSGDAARAMQALNGKDFDGRSLKINEAQDKPRSGGGNSRY